MERVSLGSKGVSKLPGEGSHPLNHQLGVDGCLHHPHRPRHRAHSRQVGQASLLQLLLQLWACYISVGEGGIRLSDLLRGQGICRRVPILVIRVVEVETDKLVTIHGGRHLKRRLGIRGSSRDGW